MATYKVTYFDFAGSRGEECRLTLVVGGVEFDDDRVKNADWAKLKPTMPFGAMPVLEVAGKGRLAQSNAILGYLGRRLGLHPSDEWEAAQHEALMAYVEELRGRLDPTMRMSDPEEKKRAREALVESYLKGWAANVEAMLGDGPFFAGAKIHVVDLKLFIVMRWLLSGTVDHVPPTVVSAQPRLMRLYEAVKTHPKVAAWYAR